MANVKTTGSAAPKILWSSLGVTIAVILLMMSCCTTIDSASVGIRFKKWSSNENLRGGVEGTCRGWVWYNPITEGESQGCRHFLHDPDAGLPDR